MSISNALIARANGLCEITGEPSTELFAYTVPPKDDGDIANQVALSKPIYDAIIANDYLDTNMWRGTTGSIWSEVPAVQVLSYKILTQLSAQDWAMEALDGAFLDESLLQWANAEADALANAVIHKDAYGAILETGDAILLTENLNVKGTNFIAPKGTKVTKIRLVPDNAEQIEGKINGSTIVILTKFVRKG